MKTWDDQIRVIEEKAPEVFRIKPDAIIGVAVDDAEKRDYFMPRLQAMLNRHQRTGTFRIIVMSGEPAIFLRARTKP